MLTACNILMVHQHQTMLLKSITKIKWLNNKKSKKDSRYEKVASSRSWTKMWTLMNQKSQHQVQNKTKVNQEAPNNKLERRRESHNWAIIRIKINQLMSRMSKTKT